MLLHKPAHELSELLKAKEISSQELTEMYINRIEEIEPRFNAYITKTHELARAKAKQVDARRAKGENLHILAGIPMAIKENIQTNGILTTNGSKMLANFIAPYDATIVHKLKNADVVLLGKTNMDEFAMGSTTENSYFGATKNPWDESCVPGGSSGGSAAAVAASEACYAIGSDTGGSIRQPAAFCGIVGLKPTYGRVSKYGITSFASSMEQAGPMTRDVEDCALVAKAISGYDEKDCMTSEVEVPDYQAELGKSIKGLRIGLPKEYFEYGIEKQTKDKVFAAIKKLEDLGAIVEEMSMPHTEYALRAYYLIAPGECSSNMACFDSVRYGFRGGNMLNVSDMSRESRTLAFGRELKKRLMFGTYIQREGMIKDYFLRAQKVRTLIRQDFEVAFKKYDLLVTSTTYAPTYEFGFKQAEPLRVYENDVYTASANLADVPAITIPCGLVDGKPVGMQLIGKWFDELTLFRVAHAFEQATDFHKNTPVIGGCN